MSDIFISYAREDLERTRQLANVLGSLGWKVFIDRRIPAGKTWADYIGKELEEAKCVIVIWSKASLVSRFVKLEANNALAKGKLIPVLIEDVSPPFEFSDLHAADLSKWDGDKNSEEFRNLVTDIESLIGSRPKGEVETDKSKVEEKKKEQEENRLKEEADAKRKVEEENRLKEEADARRKVEEEKRLKEEADAKRKAEEEKRLKEEADAKRKVEEEKRLKEKAETRRKSQEQKKKLQEQTEKVVTDLEKTTLAFILKKARYKIALIVAGIIAVTVIVILVVNSGNDGNENWYNEKQPSAEMQFWNDILTNNNTIAGFKSYQKKYPNGIYFNEAQKKINGIEDNQDLQTTKLTIGKEHQGGIIFYIDASGQHGLIAAQTDQDTRIIWGDNIKIGNLDRAIGTGKRNTDIIVAKLGAGNYAAKLCADLVLNGYSDWFLPSKDELNQLYLNKDKVDGFAIGFYWSSTEAFLLGDAMASGQHFRAGGQIQYNKNDEGYVRAVRAF